MDTPAQTILLVEDSPDDVFFMQYALTKAGITNPVQVATDGDQAVEYLEGTGKYSDRSAFPLPAVIFLDLKLPCRSGFEVLEWIRQQPALQNILVFILTGSAEERDKQKARELGAKAYLVKPPDQAVLRKIIESLNPQSAMAV